MPSPPPAKNPPLSPPPTTNERQPSPPRPQEGLLPSLATTLDGSTYSFEREPLGEDILFTESLLVTPPSSPTIDSEWFEHHTFISMATSKSGLGPLRSTPQGLRTNEAQSKPMVIHLDDQPKDESMEKKTDTPVREQINEERKESEVVQQEEMIATQTTMEQVVPPVATKETRPVVVPTTTDNTEEEEKLQMPKPITGAQNMGPTHKEKGVTKRLTQMKPTPDVITIDKEPPVVTNNTPIDLLTSK